MKMLQSGNASNVELGDIQNSMLNSTPYDNIIAKQTAPRVLATHLPTTWFSPTFRYCSSKFKQLLVA